MVVVSLREDLTVGVDVGHTSDHETLHNRYNNSVDVRTGTIAARPGANAVPANSLYIATDEAKVYQSNGATWVLLSPGTTDHALLTNVTADQHHAENHAARHATGQPDAVSPASIGAAASAHAHAHTDLTGVTADQHHAQSHGHTGADGSGTVSHANLTGVSADQHHTENHASRHSTGQPDAITPANIGASATGHTHVEANITDLTHNDTAAIHDNVSGEISAITEKTTLANADLVLIEDSAASNAKKRVTVQNLRGSATGPTVVRKATDESITSNNVLQDDNELVVAAGANEKWRLYYNIYYDSSAVADFKFSVIGPTGSTGYFNMVGIYYVDVSGAQQRTQRLTLGNSMSIEGSTTTRAIQVIADVSTSSTAGNIVFQWAQDNASVDTTRVQDGSTVEAIKIP